MNKVRMNIIVFLLTSLLAGSCSRMLIGTEKSNSPGANFDVLWRDFDEHYGAFIPKKINWEAQYHKYRPLVSDTMSNLSLYHILVRMLDTLNDNHIYLRPTKETGLPWYNGGILGKVAVEDFDKQVSQRYLSQHTIYNSAIEYGFFPGNVGYINLKDFGQAIDIYQKAMDTILTKLRSTKGIVIEMRENGGGEDRVSQYIANRFASSKHLSFTSRLKKGPGHTDFAAPIVFYTQPEGDFQYTRPVVILTNLNVYSAGETFLLAMRQNANVSTAGDTTGGALPDAVPRDLPNGWSYRLPIADVRDAKGESLEGIGIPPDYPVMNTKEDVRAGHDKVLEKALTILK